MGLTDTFILILIVTVVVKHCGLSFLFLSSGDTETHIF